MSVGSSLPPAGDASTGSLPVRLVSQLASLVLARLQLAQIELEEAHAHALQRLGWLLALGLAAILTLQFGGLFLMLYYDGTARLWMMLGFVATFLLMTVIAAFVSVRLTRHRREPLADTRREIARDLDYLGGRRGAC